MAKAVLENIFLREKPARILIGLKTAKGPVYATILSKEADCTYSHTIKILDHFRKMRMVKFEKKGRIKKVVLTDDGWDIAHNVEAMIKKFLQMEESLQKEKRPVKERKKGK